ASWPSRVGAWRKHSLVLPSLSLGCRRVDPVTPEYATLPAGALPHRKSALPRPIAGRFTSAGMRSSRIGSCCIEPNRARRAPGRGRSFARIEIDEVVAQSPEVLQCAKIQILGHIAQQRPQITGLEKILEHPM